jgi:hypothetical protein
MAAKSPGMSEILQRSKPALISRSMGSLPVIGSDSAPGWVADAAQAPAFVQPQEVQSCPVSDPPEAADHGRPVS